MRLLRLFFRMIRYRASMVLVLFFLLAIAFHKKVPSPTLEYFFAFLALFTSYISAASINDISDRDIDKINHPQNKGRPLVTGEATEKDLIKVYIASVIATLIFAFFINMQAMLIMVISLTINFIYSMPPLKVSHRTHLVPFFLSIAYVVMPYLFSLALLREQFTKNDLFFVLSLYSMFIGRIILKDFRDRNGDAKYGKITILLQYGERVTCFLSAFAIIIGNILLFFALPIKNMFFIFVFELYFVSIYFTLYQLSKATMLKNELNLIALAAKLGNGLLISVLSVLLLIQQNASSSAVIIFLTILTMLYIFNYFYLLKRLNTIKVSYRG